MPREVTTSSSSPDRSPAVDAPNAPLHRSGAVARMLRMPVATLRVWERRYALTQAALTPGGQRLYSADDLRRLSLIKQLTDLGHAIGSLAALDRVQLQAVAATHAGTLAAMQPPRAALAPAAASACRLAVVGGALGARLRRPALLRQIGRPVELLGPYLDAAQAATALQGLAVDVVLIHEPQLLAGWLDAVRAAGPGLAQRPIAVLYAFAADAVCESLADAGVALLREPQPDAVLAQWLRSLFQAPAGAVGAGVWPQASTDPAPRRWDAAALADFASLSTTVACECPRHVAELLTQLSQFEAYSAQCESRNATDADLHAYLGRVAAQARADFEAALERVALHEGLLLPPSQP